jgi:hypothetical protein
MNTFIYEDNFGVEWDSYNVIFPIKTNKSIDELLEFLKQKAESYIESQVEIDDDIEESFNPWGSKYENHLFSCRYPIRVSTCLDGSIIKNIKTVEKWEGVIL